MWIDWVVPPWKHKTKLGEDATTNIRITEGEGVRSRFTDREESQENWGRDQCGNLDSFDTIFIE